MEHPSSPQPSTSAATDVDSGIEVNSRTNSSHSPRRLEIELPLFVQPFLRSGMNQRACRWFFLSFLLPKLEILIEFFTPRSKRIASGSYNRNDIDIGFIVVELTVPMKNLELKKKLEDDLIIVSSPCICEYIKNFNALYAYVSNASRGVPLNHFTPYMVAEKLTFSFKMFTDFALARNITNPMTLTYEYSEICNETTTFHDEFTQHFENSKLFVAMADRLKHAGAATKVVLSYATEMISRISNVNYLMKEMNEIISNYSQLDIEIRVQHYAYATLLIKLYGRVNLMKLVINALNCFQNAKPKNRWLALVGDFDAGKSTLAGGFKDLFGGVTININLKDDTRRMFQLGMAIGHRFVIFDDVRDIGIKNLDDNMRDYLDGHHEIILERKNRDPVTQYFPPGMITSNYLSFPEALMRRIRIIKLIAQPSFYRAHKDYFEAIRFNKTTLVVRKYILIPLNQLLKYLFG